MNRFLTAAEALESLAAGARFRFDGETYYIEGRPERIQPFVVERLIFNRSAKWRGSCVVKGKHADHNEDSTGGNLGGPSRGSDG